MNLVWFVLLNLQWNESLMTIAFFPYIIVLICFPYNQKTQDHYDTMCFPIKTNFYQQQQKKKFVNDVGRCYLTFPLFIHAVFSNFFVLQFLLIRFPHIKFTKNYRIFQSNYFSAWTFFIEQLFFCFTKKHWIMANLR